MHRFKAGGSMASAAALALSVSSAWADGTGWFSAAQVESGRLEFSAKCQTCHGAQLEGTGAPALKGRSFNLQWNGKALSELYSYVHKQMPLGNPDSLKLQEYADIVAFILSQSGLPAGDERLTPASPMNRVLTLSDTATASQAAPPTAPVKLGELTGPVKQPTTSGPTQAQLDGADADTQSWLMYNKGYRGERYSRLSRIGTRNAKALRPVCMFQLGELGTFQTGPVMYDGVLYATTHLGTYAIDASTCKKLWSHQHLAQGAEMNATNKGVAIAGGRVIRGTQDGFLYALDAKTGDLLWERQIQDPAIGAGVGAAPIVWNGMIFMGNAGGDWGIRGAMMAFRLEDGAPIWTFHTTPAGSDPGAETWEKPGSALHGGGAAWTTYALDRESETLFVPVGNPGPDYYRALRPGANLFTSSVIALDARTGKLKWSYQLRPNDDHDWDTTVVSLFDSDRKPLLAAAGKDGVLHVVDRKTGKQVFKLPVTTTLNQDVPVTAEGVRVCPVAGVQWNGAAYSAQTGLLYINAIDWCTFFKLGPAPQWVATVPYTGLANGWGTNDPVEKWAGWTNAIDPRTGKMKWRLKSPTPMYAAITPTAGGVLLTGDLNGALLVLNAQTGAVIYRFDTGGPIAGGVITYEIKGEQYVAVASGNSGGSIPLSGASTIVIFGQ
jgi:PQQ-dependent dehydrogenase (methanol/ethanol family)